MYFVRVWGRIVCRFGEVWGCIVCRFGDVFCESLGMYCV